MSESAQIEKVSQFGPPTKTAKASRWQVELAAAKKNQEDFWRDGDRVHGEYLGQGAQSSSSPKRLNLYYADTQTRSAQLSGVPKVRVRRRFADANDDVARVSADILERMLNTDIERDTDGFRKALALAKSDWLKPGLGSVRLRYVTDMKPTEEIAAKMDAEGREIAPAVPAGEEKASEDVETDHSHWRDVLWSPCRTWNEMRWRAYRWEMTVEAAEKKWGKDVAAKLPRLSKLESKDDSNKPQDAWSRIEGWEIWDKDSRKRIQYVDGYHDVLEEETDPLGLPGFWPEPEPLAANLTTAKWLPRATYYLAEDLYEEAHTLTTRIRNLVKSAKVVGVYDQASPEVKRILDEGCENELLPSAAWGAFMEKGGLAGAVQLLPLKEIVEAVVHLVEQRNVVKRDLYEITGQSDIMRGQAAEKATATEQRIKARFGSSRIQHDQDEFARFASEAQRIRAQIIAKWFDAETIIQRSNIEQAETMEQQTPPQAPGMPPGPPQKVPNRPLIEQAVGLIKQDVAAYRIDIDAESLSMTDFDAVQQENLALLKGTAEYFGAVGPLAVNPDMAAFFAELYQQAIAGMKGSQRFEPIVDRFIAKMEAAAAKPPAPPPPDPKVEQEKIKTEAIVMKAKAEQQKAGLDMQGKAMDLQFKQAELGMKAQEMQMDAEMKREDMALDREMALEEHAMGREQMQMGMAAQRAATDEKIRAARAKPKGKRD